MDLGPHAGFVVTAYAVTLLVLGATILWVLIDYRSQRRTLDELESRSLRRRR